MLNTLFPAPAYTWDLNQSGLSSRSWLINYPDCPWIHILRLKILASSAYPPEVLGDDLAEGLVRLQLQRVVRAVERRCTVRVAGTVRQRGLRQQGRLDGGEGATRRSARHRAGTDVG